MGFQAVRVVCWSDGRRFCILAEENGVRGGWGGGVLRLPWIGLRDQWKEQLGWESQWEWGRWFKGNLWDDIEKPGSGFTEPRRFLGGTSDILLLALLTVAWAL